MVGRVHAGWALALVLAGAGCGHARPSPGVAAQGVRDFEAALPLAATREDRELAQVLEASAAGAARGPSAGGMVHRQGRRLVDGAGRPIALKGVNLGGAFLWEAWIFGGKLSLFKLKDQAESHVRDGLAQLLGPEATAAFSDVVYDQMAADADLRAIAAHGFNVVRVPLNHRLLETPQGFGVVDRLLDRAEAHGVYVILDLHGAPGGQSKYFIADPDATLLWSSEAAKAATVALWRAIAARYRDRAIVAGYDLLNEPDPPDGAALVALYERIVAAVRAVDAKHLVILEGSKAAQDFSMFSRPLDDNQAYSFHLYTWFGGDPVAKVRGYAAIAARDAVPVWCGEFGENEAPAIRRQLAVFDDPLAGVAGWAFWTWKKVRNRYPPLHEILATPSWRSTIDWIADP
jgi:hypothetical protein